jgi:hypothetical protein
MVVYAKIKDETRRIKTALNWVKDIEEIEKEIKNLKKRVLVYDLIEGKLKIREGIKPFDIKVKEIRRGNNYFKKIGELKKELKNLLTWYGKYLKEEKYRPLIEWLKYNKPHIYEKIVQYRSLSDAEVEDLVKSFPKEIKKLLLEEIENDMGEVIRELPKINREWIIKELLKKAEEIKVKKEKKMTIFRRKGDKWIKIEYKGNKVENKGEVKEEEILNYLISLRF